MEDLLVLTIRKGYQRYYKSLLMKRDTCPMEIFTFVRLLDNFEMLKAYFKCRRKNDCEGTFTQRDLSDTIRILPYVNE